MTVGGFPHQRRGRRRRAIADAGRWRRRAHPGGGRGHPAAVGQNTNLGIVLLAAPLAAAAERPGRCGRAGGRARRAHGRATPCWPTAPSGWLRPAASARSEAARRRRRADGHAARGDARRGRPRPDRPAICHRLRRRVRHRRGAAARLPGSRLERAWAMSGTYPGVPRRLPGQPCRAQAWAGAADAVLRRAAPWQRRLPAADDPASLTAELLGVRSAS